LHAGGFASTILASGFGDVFHMPLRRSTRKRAGSALAAQARRPVRPAHASRPLPAKRRSQSPEAVRDYIADMAGSLAQLALASELDSLAVACDVVREIAQGNVKAQARLIRPS
jgi:hypothetical protein